MRNLWPHLSLLLVTLPIWPRKPPPSAWGFLQPIPKWPKLGLRVMVGLTAVWVPPPMAPWFGWGPALGQRGGGTIPVHSRSHSILSLEGCGWSRGSLLGLWKRVPHALDLEPQRVRFYHVGWSSQRQGVGRTPRGSGSWDSSSAQLKGPQEPTLSFSEPHCEMVLAASWFLCKAPRGEHSPFLPLAL